MSRDKGTSLQNCRSRFVLQLYIGNTPGRRYSPRLRAQENLSNLSHPYTLYAGRKAGVYRWNKTKIISIETRKSLDANSLYWKEGRTLGQTVASMRIGNRSS